MERAAELAIERKAHDVVALDLRGISAATDFFLLASGNSDVHVKAIAEHILGELRAEGTRPNHVEGLRHGHWVLIDFIDLVVHVFRSPTREFYRIEDLWGDAKRREF